MAVDNYSNITERRVLCYGDSNTYGYNPATDGRYGETERYPRRLQALLGSDWAVIEEGLPGRTAVFDDPITEGLNGLALVTPILMSHAPLDTVIVMLGTNDVKARFGCSAYLIAKGITRLVKKVLHTECWRDPAHPDVLVVAPTPIGPGYYDKMYGHEMGLGCDERSAALAGKLAPLLADIPGVRFLDAGTIPGVVCHEIDEMHLTREAHACLAEALAAELRVSS